MEGGNKYGKADARWSTGTVNGSDTPLAFLDVVVWVVRKIARITLPVTWQPAPAKRQEVLLRDVG